jgi:HlyD family secretion protein
MDKMPPSQDTNHPDAAVKPIAATANSAQTRTGMPEAKTGRVRRASISRYAWIKLAAVGAALCLLLAYMARNIVLGTPVATYAATVNAMAQTLVAAGRVATPQRVSVASVLAGRVASIPVLEGQTVLRGQLLIALDDQDLQSALTQAQAGAAQASAAVIKQRDLALPTAVQALASARSQQNQAQQQLKRIADLRKRSFVSQMQLDEAQRNFDVAQTQTRSALLTVQSNRAEGSDAIAAQASLAQAQANVQQAMIKLAQHAILAPVSGTLISRKVEPGDTVLPGAELMQLAPQGAVEIVLLLDEKNLAKLAIGQKALASADAYPDQQFEARVSYINPGIDVARGAVAVKLSVAAPPAYLRQDMTVSVDIETAYRARALLIPTAAVHDLSSPAPWVMVVRNKRAVHQVLTLGLRGDEQIETLSGLTPGEPVLLASLASIQEGQRVRSKPVLTPPSNTP